MKKALRNLFFGLVLLAFIAGVSIYLAGKVSNTDYLTKLKDSLVSLVTRKPAETVNQNTDTTPIEIEISAKNILTYESSVAVALKCNKAISVENANKFELFSATGSDTTSFWYALKIKNLALGDNNVTATFKDTSGNTKESSLTITRENYTLPFGLNEIPEWPNSSYTLDGNNLKARLDKTHRLINDYEPEDLVDLHKEYLLYTNQSGIMLRKDAADSLKVMNAEAVKATGKNLLIASGNRSFNNQYKTYAGWLKQLGQEEADKVSARPGYSEHQLGTSVDFLDQENNFQFNKDFGNTSTGRWLGENSWKYGFIMSYQPDKESTTGYSAEPWHFRYIGIDNAKGVHDSGLTLIEWLNK